MNIWVELHLPNVFENLQGYFPTQLLTDEAGIPR